MAKRKQKGICYWCGAKYHIGHKCVKSQLYQMLLDSPSEEDTREFLECSEQLENLLRREEQK